MSGSIRTIIEQHAEEAAFLWLLRTAAVTAPHYDLGDLARLDERVEAHLDGLKVAEDGWEVCRERLAIGEPGEVFAASVLAFHSGSADRISAALEVGAGSLELGRAVVSSLGWLSYKQVEPHIRQLLGSSEPMLQRIGIGASAIHRKDPGAYLPKALAREHLPVRARALRALGELGQVDRLNDCVSNFRSEDGPCRFWAAWSAALLGDPLAAHVLQQVAEAGGPFAERACSLAARRMPPAEAHEWHRFLARDDKYWRLATIAAGAIGDPALVPWLFDKMTIDTLARPAGEAFSFITGVDLAYDNLDGEPPGGFVAGPTENPDDEDVGLDPDENLPWPHLERIHAWWTKNSQRFQPGTRCLLGRPIDLPNVTTSLRIGRQRQRTAAAVELAFLNPSDGLFEVRARGALQKQALVGLNRTER